MSDFVEEIKGFVVERLQDYEDQTVYACDLANLLTEDINNSGFYVLGIYQSRQWIGSHMNECGDYWSYEKNEFGENYHNPFDEPEAFVCCVVMGYVERLISQLPYIQENWDNQIVLDSTVIQVLTNQINSITTIEL